MSIAREEVVMVIGEVCNRNVICAIPDDTVADAAALMRKHHVGDVVVAVQSNGNRMPIGVVTDRDIVVEVVAPGVDPNSVKLGDLVTIGRLVTAQETDSYVDTIRLMREHGIRRVPVIDAAGMLVGIISADDMLPTIAKDLSDLADLGKVGRQREMRTRA